MNISSDSERFHLTDEALIEMLRLDHEWALKDIFTKYNRRLFQLACGVLRDQDAAKDIVQEIFIDLWIRRHSSDIRLLSRYLSTAVKFKVLKEIRNGKCADRHLETLDRIRFVNQTEESINFHELENSLAEAIEKLPVRCREVFVLSRLENLSHKEISARLKISTKTIEVQITKALAFIRSCIEKTAILAFSVFLF
jgi:RNA polymerase sigma-70 factor (family 1)